MSAMTLIVVSKLALVFMARVLSERWKRRRLLTISVASLSIHLCHHSFDLIKHTSTAMAKMTASPELAIFSLCWMQSPKGLAKEFSLHFLHHLKRVREQTARWTMHAPLAHKWWLWLVSVCEIVGWCRIWVLNSLIVTYSICRVEYPKGLAKELSLHFFHHLRRAWEQTTGLTMRCWIWLLYSLIHLLRVLLVIDSRVWRRIRLFLRKVKEIEPKQVYIH